VNNTTVKVTSDGLPKKFRVKYIIANWPLASKSALIKLDKESSDYIHRRLCEVKEIPKHMI